MSSYDVVVVGGGVIGLATAWQATTRGLSAAVLDSGEKGAASPAAAGMLAPVTESHYGEERLLHLNLESSRAYPGFIAELEDATGSDAGYNRCGTLMVARDSDDNAALEHLYSFQKRLGLSVERLRGRDCRELEPALSPRVRGGILVEGDHQVDNRALVDALRTACTASRVDLDHARVASIATDPEGRCRGVVTTEGRTTAAGAVVLAGGCWSARIEGVPPEVRAAVRPVKGQLLHLSGPPSPALIRRNIRGLDAYMVMRPDGRLVIGATVEEMGYDTRVTAGAVHELLRAAYELVPGVVELELTEAVAGLRPAAPDNAPLLGETSMEGLIVATAHYRNGILLTPVTARAIAELLSTGRAPEQITPFSPARFAAVTA
jgi:glycine oxidase